MATKVFILALAVLGGCGRVQQQSPYVQEEKITLAKAQKEIKEGMSSADVVEVLGTPNMVTSDANHCETWVYDKISTEVSSSSSNSGVWFLLIGGDKSHHSSRSNQKTLTIIIKFDADNKVKNFTYRASSF